MPASAALACAQISIILVDDMLDDDPRGEYHRIGSGRASNFALAFQAAGMDALVGSRAGSQVRLEALDGLNRMMLTTAHGQELDIRNPADEASYWRVVENKSAPFYRCALHFGAILAEALRNPGLIAQHSTYNCGTVESGVMIPISLALAIAPARVCTPNFR